MPMVGDRPRNLFSGAMDAVERGLGYVGDQAGRLRYGVPTSEKERLAEGGTLPGAPAVPNDEQDNRYASGYLFGQTYPNAAPIIQPMIDRVKTSGLPFLGGDSADVQSFAGQGVSRGRMERDNQDRARLESEAKGRALARMAMR